MDNRLGHIWIPGNVPSKKNDKVVQFKFSKFHMKGKVKISMGGRPALAFVAQGARTKKYETETKKHYINNRELFHRLVERLEKPYYIQFYFVRSSKRKFDFNNANHTVTDLMVKYEWLEDDDCSIMLPIPPLNQQTHHVDTKNPGVWITVKKYRKSVNSKE
jgi:hypothetical protein